MFVRGTSSAQEYRRVDNSIYRGIVVKNNDPLKLNRVKIYIPELSNQPFDDWFEKYETFILKAPGVNVNPKTEREKATNADWTDSVMFEEICKPIPWAEPCSPLLGESGDYRTTMISESGDRISFVTDCNYPDGFRLNDKYTPNIELGSFSPAYLYEYESTIIGDAFSNPNITLGVKCNPYSFSYRPSKHVNKAKGGFGIPEVGSKVWVFHYEGDLLFPVYFGVYRDYRELAIMNDTDNDDRMSPKYPSDFENKF